MLYKIDIDEGWTACINIVSHIWDWISKNQFYRPWKEVPSFTQCQNEVVLSGLLLLAAIRTSGLDLWWSSSEKVKTVCDCKAPWCWTKTSTNILAGCEPCVAHIKVYFTSSLLSDIFHEFLACHPAPTALPLLTLPDTTISGPTSSYLNWQKTCFLANWLEDGFKGKELLHNMWKFAS